LTTKDRLLAAAAETLSDHGIAGLSARTIAAAADVNQALIFYHFGTVDDLVDAACRQATDQRVEFYRAYFADVTTLPDLLRLGRELHEREREMGNVAMMAQLMAGAQRNATLARAGQYAMAAWSAEIETVVARCLAGSPLAEIADVAGLARAVSAAFIGLELYEGVDPQGATTALDALDGLAVLIDVVDDLGPVARKALRAKVRRRNRTA